MLCLCLSPLSSARQCNAPKLEKQQPSHQSGEEIKYVDALTQKGKSWLIAFLIRFIPHLNPATVCLGGGADAVP